MGDIDPALDPLLRGAEAPEAERPQLSAAAPAAPAIPDTVVPKRDREESEDEYDEEEERKDKVMVLIAGLEQEVYNANQYNTAHYDYNGFNLGGPRDLTEDGLGYQARISLDDENGLGLKRTEIPAVEDDPSIKPYGCAYESCLRQLERGKMDTSCFRTIKELREHCTKHKKDGEKPGETPYRCALDPCGKMFKSLAGLLWHFQSAAANGHFFVSLEEGEDRPSKKFKPGFSSTADRKERCPIPGCRKAFKQPAGLAYHIAHTQNHPPYVTESMIETFSVTLASKVRWWFRKLNLPISGDEPDDLDFDEGFDNDDEDEYTASLAAANAQPHPPIPPITLNPYATANTTQTNYLPPLPRHSPSLRDTYRLSSERGG